MASKKIGIVLAADGERQFSQSLSNAKKEASALNSELKRLETEYNGSANSLEFLQKKQENLSKQTTSYAKAVEEAKKGLSNAQEAQKKAASRYQELTSALEKAKDAQRKLEESGKTGTKEHAEQAKSVEQLEKAVAKQGTECQKSEGKVSDWSKKVSDSQNSLKKCNQAVDQNAKYLNEARNAADGCATSIDGLGKATEGATETTSTWGEKFKNAFAGAAVGAAANALGAIKDKATEAAEYVVDVGSSFEASMSKVQALSGAAGAELDALQNKAQELGRSTQYSATDVADAFSYMALAGWNTDQMLSSISGVLSLAAASEMDLADASDIVTDYISAFGMEASDASHFVDVMATAMSKSNTDTEQLGEAYKNCASTAGAFGYSVEETTAALMTMANSGVKGGEAGTALNAVMVRLATNTKGCADALKDYGVNIYDSDGNMRNLSEILTETAGAFAGLTDEQKANLAKIVAGQNQYSSFQTILNGMSDSAKESGQSFEDYTEQLKNCDGAAQDMMNTMQDNLQGDMKALDSAMEGLGIAAYSYIDGPLRSGVQGVTGVINGITDAISPQKAAIDDMYKSALQSSKEIAGSAQAAEDGLGGTIEQKQTLLQGFVKEVQDANGEVEKLIENAKNTVATAAVDTSSMESYKRILLELNGVEGKNEYQKYQIKAIVEQLSGDIPELAKAFDEETGSVKLTNDEIEKLINSQEKLVMQKALSEAREESLKAVADATINLAKAESAEKSAKEEASKQLKDYNDAVKNSTNMKASATNAQWIENEATKEASKVTEEARKNLAEAQQQNEDLEKALVGLDEQYGLTTEEVTHNSSAMDANAAKQEQLSARQNDTAESAENLAEATSEASDAMTDASDAAQNAMQQILDAYDSAMESIKADLRNKISFSDKFDGGDDLTTEKMNENLQSWVDGLQNYQQNLQRVKEMTDESGAAIFSPEFIQAIEAQGTDAANMLQHMVSTYDGQGEYGAEQLKGIAEKWTQAMDISDDTATVMAANETAYELAAGKLGSSETDFSNLRESISAAVESAAEGWTELPEATQEAILQTVQLAQECGVQIPEGLANGIASGEISPQQAIEQLNGTIEGTVQGVAEIANKAGVQIPEEIQSGIDAGGTQAVSAMQQLLGLIQQQAASAQEAGANVGAAVGTGAQESIKSQQAGIEQAGGEMAEAGATAAEDKKSEYEKAGTEAAQQFQAGINEGKNGAASAAGAMASQAVSMLRTYQSSFRSAGYNIALGAAQGISSGQSAVVTAAINMMRASLAAAKAEAQIHSPSRKFAKEVGYQIPAGTAAGITANTIVATKAAGKMSSEVLENATGWLEAYNKNHAVSLENEKWYWQQILSSATAGSSAYKKAVSELNKLDSDDTISSALNGKISKNFGVSKTTGTGKKKKQKSAETYNSDVLSAAEKQLKKYETLNATSLAQEKNYWTAVRKHLKSGTEAWYEATRKIQDLDTQIYEEKQTKQEEEAKTRASVQKSLLETYQTYYSMSSKAEAEYWNIARTQFKAGTDERIEADQKYLDAKKDYEKESKKLDEDYKEKREKLEKELSKTVQELEEKRQDAVKSRKKDILSSMSGYDAWDASGYTADRLIHNMQTQVEGLKLWEAQLKELSGKGLADGLLQELEDAGPEAAANIYSLNQMTAEQLDEFNKLWEEKQAIAERQAEKDTKATWDSIGQQIDEAKKSSEKELEDLKKEYDDSVSKLNEGLSTGLKSLVEQAGQIGEDIVGNLIAGMQKAGTAGTPISIDVLPAGGASEASNSGSDKTNSNAGGTSGSGKDTSAAQKKDTSAADIKKLIDGSAKRSKTVSSAEKKKHSELWQYIAKKYGRSVSEETIKKIADILGVKTSKTTTTNQKKAILAAMKKKGLRTGSENIIEDQLAWLFENNAQEYVLRKSDGAVMQNMLSGDKVINPAGAENLYNFAMNPDQFLKSRNFVETGTAGIEKLNRLIQMQGRGNSEEVRAPGNGNIMGVLNQLLEVVQSMMPGINGMKDMKIMMDSGAVVGEIRNQLNTENEMAAIRRTRGRIR